MKFVLSLWAVFLCLISISHSMDRNRNKICYKAMTCIHNGREKCGSDSKGKCRRFYDSCDMLEYNCLKGTKYAKVPKEKCCKLPPIDDGPQKDEGEKRKDVSQAITSLKSDAEGIQGNIKIDDDGIEGEIEIDDDLVEIVNQSGGGDSNEMGNDDDIEGEININDDDGSIEGSIKVDDDLIDAQLENKGDNYEPEEDYIEGEIEMSDADLLEENAGKGVEGEVIIDDDGNIQASIQFMSDEVNKAPKTKKPDPIVDDVDTNDADGGGNDDDVEGEIEIEDEPIEGKIESLEVNYE